MTKEQQKFYDIKHFSDYNCVGEDIDYIVLVDDKKKEVILQFEETDSREDWKHNFEFIPWPLSLDGKTVWTTRGYACAYKSAMGIPVNDFSIQCINHPGYKRIIRGWSFGSAMAKIAARHYTIRFGHLDELTTFGDVKCWLNPFYGNTKCKRVRNYVTPNDAVTWCVPFYSRDKKCKVGERFSLVRLFRNPAYYHTNYDKYDYTRWCITKEK